MVFRGGSCNDVDIVRYATEAEAIEGHRKCVEKWEREERIKEVSSCPKCGSCDFMDISTMGGGYIYLCKECGSHRNCEGVIVKGKGE